MDPVDSGWLYGGTNRVWRTVRADEDATWTVISNTDVAGGGTLNAIAIAPSRRQTIYTGSSTGRVFVATHVPNWSDRSAGLPEGEISDICIDTHDDARAYVAFYNTTGPRVLHTDNHGVAWTDVSGALPDGVAARALEVDWRFNPPRLYVGSGAGVYESVDAGATWSKDGTDLPNVNIGDLKIDRTRWTLTAGTYGRGAWRKQLPFPPGDLNCDDAVDFGDINPFVLALSNPAAYDVAFPGCAYWNADINNDGAVNIYDINPFIALLNSK
jgi:hypothetical protein